MPLFLVAYLHISVILFGFALSLSKNDMKDIPIYGRKIARKEH